MKKITLLLLLCIVLFGGFLRFYKITTVPPGLYIDEVAIGLNAYDILKTGKDQFGYMYPLAFKSYGDYKMPLYVYAVTGAMTIFGKNEFAIRFPSALAGTLTLVIVFFLTRNLLLFYKATQKHADILSLCAAGLLAITPWHLQFSRGGFEVTLAGFFYLLGLLLAVMYWQNKKLVYLLGTVILFLFSMYTYQTYRIFVPISFLAGCILALYNKERRRDIFIGLGVLFLLSLPLIFFSFSLQGRLRFVQATAFGQNPYHSGILRIVTNGVMVIQNYISFYSITYLFRFGDQINRHQVNNLGILYIWQLPFIIAGIYLLAKTKNKMLKYITLFLLLAGPIPATIVVPSPHTLRFLIGAVVYAILTILGIYQIFLQNKKWVRYFFIGILIFAVVEFGYYLNYYYVNYPQEALIDWGGSCKQAALDMQKVAKQYQHIVIERNIDCAPESFTFYTPEVPFTVVAQNWVKPNDWGKTLLLRTYYGNPSPDNLIHNVYLPNLNHDVFIQFYNL